MSRYDDDDDDYRPGRLGRYSPGSRRYDSRDQPLRRRRRPQTGSNALTWCVVVGGAVVFLFIAGGLVYVLLSDDRQPPQPRPVQPAQAVKGAEPPRMNPPVNPPVDPVVNDRAGAFTNSLARPMWRKYRVADYEVELPGAPRVDLVTGGLKKARFQLLKYELVSFTDSDLELMFYFVPLPESESRLLARFYKEFDFNVPVKDSVKDNALLTDYMDLIRDEQVMMDGKIGWHLTFQRRPNQLRGQDMVQCRMLRMEKGVHILVAAGNHVPDAEAVVDRFFNSLKVDGKQPEDPDPTKPVPLAKRWRKHSDPIGGFEIDMPGVPEKTRNNNKSTFERLAVVHVDGADLEFVVAATRRSKRDKLSDDDFFKEARQNFLDSVPDGEVVKEERIKVDGRVALQIKVKTDLETIIWRVVRVPERRYEFEIEVSGGKLEDYQSDIERFFASFKFQK